MFEQIQTNFNVQLDAERRIIEQAFGLLKGKWRKLKYLDVTNLSFLPEIIVTACIFHNFILDVEGPGPDGIDVDLDDGMSSSDEDEHGQHDVDFVDLDEEEEIASNKRNRLAHSL